MLGRIFTVGGYTLLSRLTGFARDIMLAAILGAGPLADAFFVALRLPNHFRAIFAEGAFNAAFVPAYAHVRGERGEASARLFADRIFTLLFFSQLLLLILAWLFMPQVIAILAPGFSHDPERGQLAIELTRITFPYLLLVTLVTLYGGMLNVMHRFASAAAAPIFLNLSMMVTLALAAFFPGAGYAAAWGVLIAGILEFFLLAGDAWRSGILAGVEGRNRAADQHERNEPDRIGRERSTRRGRIAPGEGATREHRAHDDVRNHHEGGNERHRQQRAVVQRPRWERRRGRARGRRVVQRSRCSGGQQVAVLRMVVYEVPNERAPGNHVAPDQPHIVEGELDELTSATLAPQLLGSLRVGENDCVAG